ncbi:MAG: ADOP family duplicated permease [Longimicrobiales bacterium]
MTRVRGGLRARLERWVRRALYLRHRDRAEFEMDEEFTLHVELDTEANRRRGMSPREARRRALLAFGGVERFKEEGRDARGTRWLEDLMSDVRYAGRQLRRSPGFAAVAVLTLALGIGATTAIFSVVNGVLLRSLPFEEPERLVRLRTVIEGEGGGSGNLSPPNFLSLREETRAFADIVSFETIEYTWTGGGAARNLEGARVSAGFFEVLGEEPVLGRTFRSEENLPGNTDVVVLGHGLWRQAFGGDPRVLGRTITLDGVAHMVVGVMPPGFSFPEKRALWVPRPYTASWSAATTVGRKSNTIVPVLARLAPGQTLAAARVDLAAAGRRLSVRFPETNAGVGFTAVPLLDDVVGDARTPLLLLFGAAGFVLLIACANVVGLLLARATTRREELAARAALGAGRGRLVRQLLAESLVLGALGGGLGLLAAWLGTEALLAARPEGLPRLDDVRVDGAVLAFATAVTLLAGVTVALAPAVQATRGMLSERLRAGGRNELGTRAGTRVRAGLVVCEVALAVLLLAGAGLLIRSFVAITAADAGFRTERVLAFELDLDAAAGYDSREKIRMAYDEIVRRLANLPDVEAAAAVFRLPIAPGPFTSRFLREGEPPPTGGRMEPSIYFQIVTTDYFRVMEIPIVRGRGFTEDDRAGSLPGVVINRAAAARFFPDEDAIGQRLDWFSFYLMDEAADEFTIVGVVGDVRHKALTRAPEPTAYFAHQQVPADNMTAVVRTVADPLAVSGSIRAALDAFDPNLALRGLTTLDQALADSVSRPRFSAALLGLFAVIALTLAGIGVFGLLSFAVARQTREIGIRIALGARPGEVIRRVVAGALALAGTGLLVGLLAAFALTRLLESMLFGVSPSDPASYAVVSVLLGATIIVAAALPARRAATVDPMVALRHE